MTGYALPWPTHFVGLAAVITQNKFVVFMMALSFMLFNLWWVALSYLAFPRILFAWGMDRMGPKWFADIDYRWASPVKNHILCFILGEIGIALYSFRGDPMEGLSVTGMEIVSVFGVTAIAAAIFPFSKRAKQIWDASPYKKWNILGIPVVTIGAVVNLIYLGILFYFFYFMADMGEAALVRGSFDSLWNYLGSRYPLVFLLEISKSPGGCRCQHDIWRTSSRLILEMYLYRRTKAQPFVLRKTLFTRSCQWEMRSRYFL